MSDIAIVRPTGVLVRSTPQTNVSSNIVGAADYGEVFRDAVSQGEWWVVEGSRYIAIADAIETATHRRSRSPVVLKPLSQRDPQWAGLRLGNSSIESVTVGDYGCLLVCFTIVANAAYTSPIRPDRMNEVLKANGGFMPPGPYGGRAARFDLRPVTNGRVALTWVSDRRGADLPGVSPDAVERLLQHLQSGMPAILEVDFYPDIPSIPGFPGRPGQQQHFVVALPFEEGDTSGTVRIIDPWSGEIAELCPRFGPAPAQALYRVALYQIDPERVPAPEGQVRFRLPDQTLLGVHTLVNGRAAQTAFERGCRLITIMDNFGIAAELADRGAWVMARKYWPNYVPKPEQYLRAIGDVHPGVIYVGLNENDSIGSSPDEIRARAAFDIEVAGRIWRETDGRAIYAAGGFATGTPDFGDPAVCLAIREGYAEAYNAGQLLFDMHNYAIRWKGEYSIWDDASLIWWMRRWEFLFTRCGFDPRVRGVISSETGLDTGKGFAGNHINTDDVVGFCARWFEVQDRELKIGEGDPLVASGDIAAASALGAFPSPYIGGTLFQYGEFGNAQWDSFNIEPYFDQLGNSFWT